MDKIDEITMLRNMNIYQKIQAVKKELSERELKKSGENKFSGFKYYELGDFLPSIIELCAKYGLFTQITFTEDKGILNIVDCNAEVVQEGTPSEYRIVQYESPLKELELKGANAIQALGGAETYLRRYLYMNAFDIVEADMFDSAEFEKKKKAKTEKTALEKIINDCKEAFKKSDDDIKKETGTLMKSLGYATFADITKAQNKQDILSLAELLKVEIPAELQEENNAQK
jgi:hypothetical protein